MTIALYIDENVPRQITDGLRQRGIDVLTIQEDGRSGISDLLVLHRASELQRVVFSQDQDFLAEAAARQAQGIDFIGVIYARKSRMSIGDCVRDLELIATACDLNEFFSRVQYLPL